MHNFVKKREVIAEQSDFDRKCMDARSVRPIISWGSMQVGRRTDRASLCL